MLILTKQIIWTGKIDVLNRRFFGVPVFIIYGTATKVRYQLTIDKQLKFPPCLILDLLYNPDWLFNIHKPKRMESWSSFILPSHLIYISLVGIFIYFHWMPAIPLSKYIFLYLARKFGIKKCSCFTTLWQYIYAII